MQYLGELGETVKVYRNDKITIDAIKQLRPAQIVISPGPGGPQDAGISCDAVRAFAGQIPLLGRMSRPPVYRLRLWRTDRARKTADARQDLDDLPHNRTIFKGVPNPV